LDHFNWRYGLVLLAAAINFGCGSDSNAGGGACSLAAGCGGDIVGTWNISSFCAQEPDMKLTETCGDVNLHIGAGTATGTLTFNADGTQTQSVNLVVQETGLFPISCISSAAACTAAEARVDAEPGASDGHCSFSSAGCTCTFNVTEASSDGGKYTLSGTTVILQNATEASETDPYCVSGNTLTLQTSDGQGNAVSVTATR